MRLGELLSRFPRLFWLVNAMELFERGAYYGMLAVLPYYLVYSLHFASTAFGVILSILTPFLYLLPIVSGALVEKYGFRLMLALSLGLVVTGYLLSSLVTTFEAFVLAFVVFGTGVGSFKPIISATIAHTTAPEQRNLGYSIYYWIINLGSFTMPFIISLTIPKEQYVLVFYLSAALIGVNLALTLLFYRDPVPPKPGANVAQVFKGAALVVKDLRFMALLLIYSGFWFMYATNHLAILLYALDFGVLADWFPPALVAIVNPGTIILIGPFLGRLFEKRDSLRVMILGMAIFILGLLLMGFTTEAALFFTGIVVFSIGEFVTHPTYIAYVSKIAPKERVTVYMAYAFIPPLIGLSLGNALGGVMYSALAEEMHRPKLFWAAMGAVGLATMALLLIYSQTLARRRADELESISHAVAAGGGESGAGGAVEGERAAALGPAASVGGAQGAGGALGQSVARNFVGSRLSPLLCILLIPVLIGGAYGGGASTYLRELSAQGGSGWEGYSLESSEAMVFTGSSQENSETVVAVDIEERLLACVTFTLRWRDEEDIVRFMRTYENRPDEFGIAVVSPNGTAVSSQMVANERGREGSVSIHLALNFSGPREAEGNGTYDVSIVCGSCGDFFPAYGVIGFTDTGNDWALEVVYEYYAGRGA